MRALWCAACLVVSVSARAQQNTTPYPSMAPLDQYLISDRAAEIALARSAAPDAISRDAKILVLGRHGYETVAQGTNGFACLVERSWMAGFGHPQFWNPKIRSPVCYNPAAVRSMLPYIAKRTELVVSGIPKAQIIDRLTAALAKKELPALAEPGAMSYMMSKEAYSSDNEPHALDHLMFYTPVMAGTDWGAGLKGTPVILGAKGGPGEPYSLFLVPVGLWSDGTASNM